MQVISTCANVYGSIHNVTMLDAERHDLVVDFGLNKSIATRNELAEKLMHSLPASGLKFPILRVVHTGAAPAPLAVVTWTALCSFVRRETAQFRTFPHGTAAVMPNLGLLVRFHSPGTS